MLTLIGNTPLVKIDGTWVKCEHMNPTGSSKDRIAYEMLINEPRKIILETSSGNTGVSVSFVCSILNKRCMIFAPQSTSRYKVKAMKAYGATVDNRYKDIKASINAAVSLMNGSTTMRYLNQFNNKYNKIAQIKMAKEITDNGIFPDAVVCGIGTSGTLAGLHSVFKDATFYTPRPFGFSIEGICDGVNLPLKPKECNLIEVPVTKYQVQLTCKYLATKKGLWIGASTAANFLIANKIRNQCKTVLMVAHDAGWKYGT
jgi:cysteine synthase A